MTEQMTKDWKLYEAGIKFNNSHRVLENAKVNTEFYEGEQWIGAKETRLAKPTFNILKRIGSYFIASLTSSPIKIFMRALLYENLDKGIANQLQDPVFLQLSNSVDIANSAMEKVMERNKYQFKIREAVENSVKTGDMVFHFRFDTSIKPYVYAPQHLYKGDIVIDVLDGVNVFFGNPNSRDVQSQPYILIDGRDTLENLRQEAHSKEVQADNETDNFIRGDIELEADDDSTDKATYIIKYYKKKDKDGNVKVYANKSTRGCKIYEGVDTGLTLYPIAFENWEHQSGNYHGRALVTGMIPNQVFINKMWAMSMFHLQMNAFPKMIYNASKIQGVTNEIGTAIPVHDNGDPNFNVNNIVTYLEPAPMSSQVPQMLDLCMDNTKDTMGITDATLGNVNPTNTSAIVAVQKSSAVPLKNQQANLYYFVEQTAYIMLDMISNKYGIRDIAIDMNTINYDYSPQPVAYDYGMLKDLALSLDIEVGEGNYYDEIAQQSTLDNLLMQNKITLIQYLERVSPSIFKDKEKLLKELRMMEEQAKMLEEQNAMMGIMPQSEGGQPAPSGRVKPSVTPQSFLNMSDETASNLVKAMQSLSGEKQLELLNKYQK